MDSEVVVEKPVVEVEKVEEPVKEPEVVKDDKKIMSEKITKSGPKKVTSGKKLSQISKQAKEAKAKVVEVTEPWQFPVSPAIMLSGVGGLLFAFLLWRRFTRSEPPAPQPPVQPPAAPRPAKKFEDLD